MGLYKLHMFLFYSETYLLLDYEHYDHLQAHGFEILCNNAAHEGTDNSSNEFDESGWLKYLSALQKYNYFQVRLSVTIYLGHTFTSLLCMRQWWAGCAFLHKAVSTQKDQGLIVSSIILCDLHIIPKFEP